METIRVKFRKSGYLRFISHLDLMRLFQRALMRADIPVHYSQGFNPHPKFSFATALALGIQSEGEYMDVELTEKVNESEFINNINEVLPSGVKLLKAKYVKDKKSIMSLIRWSSYLVELTFKNNIDAYDLKHSLESIMQKEHIFITKEKKKKNKIIKKEIDIRKYINEFELLMVKDNKAIIKTTLKTGSQGNLKPKILLEQLKEIESIDFIDDMTKIQRLELFIEKDGNIVVPI